MSDVFSALMAEESEGRVTVGFKELTLSDLPDEEVLVQVTYSSLNYKDGLAVTGKGKIIRRYPMVCGIDLAGTVAESRSAAFHPGERVLINGYGLSEHHWGGYTPWERVDPAWLLRIPAPFTPEQSMGIGTAGYTAALSVLALQDHGVRPDAGEVLVTGATGGVGSVAVALLAGLGYTVIASTGRPEFHDYLRARGASGFIDRGELARPSRPLESERWAAGIDTVGSTTLATVLAQTRHGGTIAACGLAAGMDLPSTVAPFILRGVTLTGIESGMAPASLRQRAWELLAQGLPPEQLAAIYRVEPLSRVPELAEEIVGGRLHGRIAIDVNA